MKELVISKVLKGVEESKARQIEAVFAPMVTMLKEFENAYNKIVAQEVTEDLCKKAKRLRLDIAKIRVSADKERKIQKDEYLRAGNAIQGVYNILKFAVVEKEDRLRSIENYFENLKKEEQTKLQIERALELEKYEVAVIPENLGAMQESVWENFITGTRVNYENQKEAERKAEEQRIELERIHELQKTRVFQCSRLVDYIDNFESIDFGNMKDNDYSKLVNDAKATREAYRKEQEQIKLDNEKLKKEQEKAEAKRITEAKKVETERLRVEKENNDKLEAERKKAEAEKLKIQVANDLKLKKEREEKERLQKSEADRLAKLEAEKQSQIEAEKQAQAAPDKDKLKELLRQMEVFKDKLKLNITDVKSKAILSKLAKSYEIILITLKKDLM